MNKRFLLTAFAISAFAVSNDPILANPNSANLAPEDLWGAQSAIERKAEHIAAKQQLRTLAAAVDEAMAEEDSAVNAALAARAAGASQSELDALIEKCNVAHAKVTTAHDNQQRSAPTKETTIRAIVENNLKKEEVILQAAGEVVTEARTELETLLAAQRAAAKNCFTPTDIKAAAKLDKEVEAAQTKLDAAEKAHRELHFNRPTSLEQYFKKTESSGVLSDEAKAFITNAWVKRTAYVLIACTVCSFVYDNYKSSDRSEDKE